MKQEEPRKGACWGRKMRQPRGQARLPKAERGRAAGVEPLTAGSALPVQHVPWRLARLGGLQHLQRWGGAGAAQGSTLSSARCSGALSGNPTKPRGPLAAPSEPRT